MLESVQGTASPLPVSIMSVCFWLPLGNEKKNRSLRLSAHVTPSLTRHPPSLVHPRPHHPPPSTRTDKHTLAQVDLFVKHMKTTHKNVKRSTRSRHQTTGLKSRFTVQDTSRQSSGAVWKSRWPSWAFRPNEPYGFCGRKATLNHASALVTVCPLYDIRGHETLHHHHHQDTLFMFKIFCSGRVALGESARLKCSISGSGRSCCLTCFRLQRENLSHAAMGSLQREPYPIGTCGRGGSAWLTPLVNNSATFYWSR